MSLLLTEHYSALETQISNLTRAAAIVRDQLEIQQRRVKALCEEARVMALNAQQREKKKSKKGAAEVAAPPLKEAVRFNLEVCRIECDALGGQMAAFQAHLSSMRKQLDAAYEPFERGGDQ